MLTKLKQKVKLRTVNSALNTPVVKTYLKQLHSRTVVVTIDKASNNFPFICKKLYIRKILCEVGLNGDTPSKTYYQIPIVKNETVNTNVTY